MSSTSRTVQLAQNPERGSYYDVEEQTDDQLLFVTHPAQVPTFTFDAGVIVAGFGFTTLTTDYFLVGAEVYLAALIITAIGAGAAWSCLKILHRERRKGISPGRFYVSNVSINIPPAPDSNDKMTLLQGSNIDRWYAPAFVDG